MYNVGALVVTLRQGNFKGKEEGFLETLLTGSEPDPYIVVSVLENENSLPPETFAAKLMRTFQGQKEPAQLKSSKGSFARVLDSAKSAQKVCPHVSLKYFLCTCCDHSQLLQLVLLMMNMCVLKYV